MDTTEMIERFDAGVEAVLQWFQDHLGFLYDALRVVLESFYGAINAVFQWPPDYVIVAVVVALCWRLAGRGVAVLAGLGLLLCMGMGLWGVTMDTLGLVVSATSLALLIGLPTGIVLGYLPKADRIVEPFLDMMQTLPPYIYLLPSIALMGYGPATALLATVLVAVPPAIKLASLGIRMTPREFIELGQANGVTKMQMFLKIRLPFAVPSILAGMNQSLMMAFGMVVIAGIVGSGGLGETIYGAIRTLDIAKSIDATVAIVVLTMALDRITQGVVGAKSRIKK